MLRSKIIAAGCCFLASLGNADVDNQDKAESVYGLDLQVKAAELESSFPILLLNNGQKTRDALTNHRQALERYRAQILEGFSREIAAICDRAKRHEAELHSNAREGTISRSLYLRRLDEIEYARLQCDTKHYRSSRYWRLYDRMLRRYQSSDKEVQRAISDCFSQNSCRQRKN